MKAAQLYRVIKQIRPAQLELGRSVERELRGTGLGLGTRAVLEALMDGGPQTVPGIAAGLSLPRQGVQRSVDSLARDGLVRRLPNPAHKRSPLVETTAAGARVWRRVHDRELEILAEVARSLDRKQIASCVAVMSHVANSFEARNRDQEP